MDQPRPVQGVQAIQHGEEVAQASIAPMGPFFSCAANV